MPEGREPPNRPGPGKSAGLPPEASFAGSGDRTAGDARGSLPEQEVPAQEEAPVAREAPAESPPDLKQPPLTEEEEGYLAQLQRLQAEFSNYRKRIARERADWETRAKGDLVNSLIPVLDDLARARDAHAANPPSAEAEGLLLILTRLEEALSAAGLERQRTEPGTPFDPHIHEALLSSPSEEHQEGTIIETIQAGYLFHGRLLRPARVRVSQGPSVAVS